MKRLGREKGFTLIEIILIMGILWVILMGVMLSFDGANKDAKIAKARTGEANPGVSSPSAAPMPASNQHGLPVRPRGSSDGF